MSKKTPFLSDIQNLPNFLSIIRVPGVFLSIYLFLAGFKRTSVIVGILACITDYADGIIARRRGLVTDIGEILDQFGDSTSTLAMLITGVYLGFCSIETAFLFAMREFWVYAIRRYVALKNEKIPSIFLGKLASNFLFWGGAVLFFAYAGFLNDEISIYFRYLCLFGIWAGLVMSYMTSFTYTRDFIKIYNRVNSGAQE